jgi:phage terminase large subunit
MKSLFESDKQIRRIAAWKPQALSREQWPPNYDGVYVWRQEQLRKLRFNPALLQSAKAYYAKNRAEFVLHWCDTYNPRSEGNKWVPFVMFERQWEFSQFYYELKRDQESGLTEKCRDMGATWLICGLTLADWLFEKEVAISWGSRKQDLVDKLGDSNSIFEKIRLMLKRLPEIWHPTGYNPREHATYMKLINPANGSTITGEAGDNIGRGGRSGIYVKDESAHYERPEKIQAALDDNTNVQLDISSVNGLGNVFHRRRKNGVDWSPNAPPIEAGKVRVFIFDWKHNPMKTQEWYDKRKAQAELEGLQHIFAQEVERNYSAAVIGTIINGEHVSAAIDAHKKFNTPIPNTWMAGLDVADGGQDRNALAMREWVILRRIHEWGGVDTAVTTQKTLEILRTTPEAKTVQYDSIGVGSGVKAEFNRMVTDGTIGKYNLVSWNAGAAVKDPYLRVLEGDDASVLNKDFYHNFKAQAWWSLRTRFYKTWRFIKFGDIYPYDELISLDSEGLGHMLDPLRQELCQPVKGTSSGLKMLVEKTPDGTRSPNLADAVVMAFFPAPENQPSTILGSMT